MTSLVLAWKALPAYARYLGLGAMAVLLILGSVWLIMSKAEAIQKDGFKQGQTQVREEAAQVVIERVEKSNEVGRQMDLEAARGSGDLRYAQCVRSARTPANCQRLLPGGSADHD